MKSKILAALFISGLAVSFGASATAIDSGVAITPAECVLLGENVVLNLSNNVSGSYNCDQATSTITIAACHAAGSRNTATITCADSGPVGGPPNWNDASCTSTADTFEITDFRGYRASSQGGTVAPVALGGACTDATVEALVN